VQNNFKMMEIIS